MVTEVREEQDSKAQNPILVTELGMVTEVREEQYWKAPIPILVTELGMVTEVREKQYWKAELPILVTLYPATRLLIIAFWILLFSTPLTVAVWLVSSKE